MTSAIEELRRLLDERGVECEATLDSLTTWATGSDTARWCADELINDRFDLYAYNVDEDVSGLTPEQAVEATLGRGTCHVERHGSLANWLDMVCWSCSECGFGWHHSVNDKQFHYCPNCGRRVVK